MAELHWFIGYPAKGDYASKLKTVKQLETISRVVIPELPLASLDVLLAFSEEVHKVSASAESVVHRLEQEMCEQFSHSEFKPRVDGMSPAEYLRSFRWNEHNFPFEHRSLAEIANDILQTIQEVDTSLKRAAGNWSTYKTEISSIERQRDGSLATRALDDLIPFDSDLWFESKNITSVVVVVPNHLRDDFVKNYADMAELVVPGSLSLVADDDVVGLYVVCVHRSAVTAFTNKCRLARYTIRDYIPQREHSSASAQHKLEVLQNKLETAASEYVNHATMSYGPLFECWVHSIVLRCHVEGALRFGMSEDVSSRVMPTRNTRFLLDVCKIAPGGEKSARTVLESTIFSDLFSLGSMQIGDQRVLVYDKLDAPDGFFPIVFVPMQVTVLSSQQWKALCNTSLRSAAVRGGRK